MKTQAIAQLKLQRISAQKARLVADLIRYKTSKEALSILKNSNKKAARLLLKLLQSAIANAINNNGMNVDKLYLSDLTKYNKILNQRNKLLKDISFRPDLIETLSVWDTQLVETGKRIIQRRKITIFRSNCILNYFSSCM